MGSKAGAKAVQLDGVFHHNFRRAIELDGYRHGMAAKLEELMEVWTREILKKHGKEWEKEPPRLVPDRIVNVSRARIRHAKAKGKSGLAQAG